MHAKIYTVKAVKGLEFKEVFVFDSGMTINEKYISYTRPLNKLNVIKELPSFSDRKETKIIQGEDDKQEDIKFNDSKKLVINYDEILTGIEIWEKYSGKISTPIIVKATYWKNDYCMVVSDYNKTNERLIGRVYLNGQLYTEEKEVPSNSNFSMYMSPNHELIIQEEKSRKV